MLCRGAELPWEERTVDWGIGGRADSPIRSFLHSPSRPFFTGWLRVCSSPWASVRPRNEAGLRQCFSDTQPLVSDATLTALLPPFPARPVSSNCSHPFAVSLPHSPLPPEQQEAVVDACARHLLTSHGLRSLDPRHPDYKGHHGGDRRTRDAAYHQRTVWGWLMGPFVSAHLRVYHDPALARSFLAPLMQELDAHCVGSLSEILNGDPPHTPRGCIAQAWTVAEVLRVWWKETEMEDRQTEV
jgi:glycogen debranching enzyme